MRKLFILILLIVTSCTKKEEPNLLKPIKFHKINYSLQYNYLDSLGKKIIPNKKYQYWQYATLYDEYGSQKIKCTILKQGGDTLFRKKINKKNDSIKVVGIFQGGHPSYRCNYAVTIENNKVNYIIIEEEFRKFLGIIDNLEEALLLAETYGYSLDNNIKGSEYREVENGFELHLMKFHNSPFINKLRKEAFDLTITKQGLIKSKSLGIYCTGKKCLQ